MRYVGMVTDKSYMDALHRIEQKHPEWYEYYIRKACEEVERSFKRIEKWESLKKERSQNEVQAQ